MTSLVLASANTPGGSAKAKARLLRHPFRTRRLVRLLNALRVTIVGLQELSAVSRVVWLTRQRWTLIDARPNTWFRRGPLRYLGRIGNGLANRHDDWVAIAKVELVHRLRDGSRSLYRLVVLYRHSDTGETIAVLDEHLPGGPEYAADRMAMLDQDADYLERVHQLGCAVAIVGDFNWREAIARLVARGWTKGLAVGVDGIAGLGIRFSNPRVVDASDVTDHKHVLAVTADLRASTKPIQQLPRP